MPGFFFLWCFSYRMPVLAKTRAFLFVFLTHLPLGRPLNKNQKRLPHFRGHGGEDSDDLFALCDGTKRGLGR